MDCISSGKPQLLSGYGVHGSGAAAHGNAYPYARADTYSYACTRSGTIQVVKRDSATGAVLAGAVFQLYDAAGYPVGAPVMTNGNGVVAWGNLPLGNYSVQEIAAPEGYNCDNGFYSLTLTDNNLFLTIEVVNSVVYGKIRIIKTDADTQAVLAGAAFEITDAYGTVVDMLITGTDGTAESDWLPYGSYKTAIQCCRQYSATSAVFFTAGECTTPNKTRK